MKREFRFKLPKFLKNIRYKWLLAILMIVMSTTVMASTITICNRNYRSVLLKEIQDSRYDTLHQISGNIERVYDTISFISDLYFYSGSLDTIIETNEKYLTDSLRSSYNISMKNISYNYQQTIRNSGLNPLVVLSCDNGYRYISSGKYLRTYRFENLYNAAGISGMQTAQNQISILGPVENRMDDNTTETAVTFARTLYDSYRRPKGYLAICIPENTFSDLYSDFSADSSIYIVNSDGNILSAGEKQYLGKNYEECFGNIDLPRITYGNREYLSSRVYSDKNGLSVIEHLPYSTVLAPVKTITDKVLFVCFFLFLFAILAAFVCSGLLGRPLSRLAEKVSLVGGNNMNVDFSSDDWLEINQISRACSMMQKRIRNLIAENRIQEEKKRAADLNFLQLQINPHFIYNTIFCARCLIEDGDSKNASAMLVDFIGLLRWTFHAPAVTTLRESVEHIKQYVNIMKYRYAEKLTVNYHIPENVRNAKIISLILQPFIENAILHGIAPSSKNCMLTLSAERTGERLELRIFNNGVPMTAEQLREFHRNSTDSDQPHGVSNAVKRLEGTYGNEYSIRISSGQDTGTEITVSIPYIDMQDNILREENIPEVEGIC